MKTFNSSSYYENSFDVLFPDVEFPKKKVSIKEVQLLRELKQIHQTRGKISDFRTKCQINRIPFDCKNIVIADCFDCKTFKDLNNAFEQREMILTGEYHWNEHEIYNVISGYMEVEV